MNIWDALSEHADGIKHAMFFELMLCTGWSGSQQRLDAWSIPLWPSLGTNIIAYEVKTARGDFLKEIKNPEKRKAGMSRCNQFYFVTTDKIVKENEIPCECGWLLFTNEKLIEKITAPIHECDKPDWGTIRAICRRAFDSEIITMKRKLDLISNNINEDNGLHKVIDSMGEWAIEEKAKGNIELLNKIKKTLEPSKLYGWV